VLIKVAFVKNNKDINPVDKSLTFEGLVAILSNFIVSDKDNAPGIIGGYFNGKTRETHNLQARTLLILDVDYYKGSINDLEVLFKRDLISYRYIAYSTASHALNEPRIRIVLFFSDEVKTHDYTDISLNFINTLSEDFRKTLQIGTCIKRNQIMYLPVKPHDDYIPWCSYQDGKSIDPALYLEIANSVGLENDQFALTVKNNPLDITESNIINYLNNYPVEERDYYEWLEVGAALHHQYRGDHKGLLIWNTWSKRDPRPDKYKGLFEIEAKWNSFKINFETPITFATIIYKTTNTLPVEIAGDYRPINKNKWKDTKGKTLTPLLTEANFKILLDEYDIKIRFDVIKKNIEISFNGLQISDVNHGTTRIKLLCKLNKMETNGINEVVSYIAHQNVFNSWKDWVYSVPWDGVERFASFCETVEVIPDLKEIRNLYLKKWFLQLINITCLNDEPEAKVARMILVFQGKQYSGKTSWFKALVPPMYNDFITEGATLKISDTMTVLRCIQHVIVELGEINATMKRSDVDELKNFLSSSKDILNMKYAVYPVTYRRRTVFFGSVNETEFLQDQTDNTRFLCLPIIHCNYSHNINMQQVYAELLEMTKIDNNYFLSYDDLKIQRNMNSNFKTVSILEEKLQEIFEVENLLTQSKDTMVIYNATKLLEELGFNINQMIHNKKNLANEMAKVLDSHGFKRSTKPKGWYMPNKRIINNLGF
jgi:hypothetical protein